MEYVQDSNQLLGVRYPHGCFILAHTRVRVTRLAIDCKPFHNQSGRFTKPFSVIFLTSIQVPDSHNSGAEYLHQGLITIYSPFCLIIGQFMLTLEKLIFIFHANVCSKNFLHWAIDTWFLDSDGNLVCIFTSGDGTLSVCNLRRNKVDSYFLSSLSFDVVFVKRWRFMNLGMSAVMIMAGDPLVIGVKPSYQVCKSHLETSSLKKNVAHPFSTAWIHFYLWAEYG